MTGRGRDTRNAGKHAAGTTPDETELFRRTVADAKPLKKKPAIGRIAPAFPAPAAPGRGLKASPPDMSEPAFFRAGPSRGSAPAAGTPLQVGEMRDMDRRTSDRFRRGKLPIEATLDLHGCFQEAAHEALNAFIGDAVTAGRRMLLIVTGKGRVSEGGGVLRQRVPDWLSQPPCRAHVLAVTQARPEHGGSGAYYVLLRRKRAHRV